MKSLKKEALTSSQKAIFQYVYDRRHDKKEMLGVISTIMFASATSQTRSIDGPFYDKLMSSYINLQLKKVREALGVHLLEETPNFQKMLQEIENFLNDIKQLQNINKQLVPEGLFKGIEQVCQKATDTVMARQNSQVLKTIVELTSDQTLESEGDLALLKKDGMFYLKDRAAVNYLRNQGAKIEQKGSELSISGPMKLPENVCFKIKKGTQLN